jgi:CysZ protein
MGGSRLAAAPPRSLLAGFHLPLEALGLLRRERRLWPLALLPMLLSLAAFAGAIALVVACAGDLYAWATAWLPVLAVERWYEWLWIGPARAVLAAFGAALFLAIAAAAVVLAYLLASVLASPVHDVLSARVEQIVTGGLVDSGASGLWGLLREAGRAAREELRRMLFFLALTLPLFAAGVLVPGAQLVTGPALLAVTVFFLPLDYASYTLDRRRVPFALRRRWLLANKPVMTGFGLAAFLTFSIPGLSFLAMPVLVVAGTLLALRLRPPEEPEGGAGV